MASAKITPDEPASAGPPIVNMHEAKSRLSQLVEAIESGRETEIVLARNGKPAVRLVPLETVKPKRKVGFATGRFNFDYDAFQALDAEVQRLFEESADPYGEKLDQ